MDRLTAARVFTVVARRRSLTAAALELQLSRAMVSRYVAAMEAWAGGSLLHRTTRKVSLTPHGTEVLEWSTKLLETAENINVAGGAGARPSGVVRLAATTMLGRRLTLALASDFFSLSPKHHIQLLSLTGDGQQLMDSGFDFAIVSGRVSDNNMITKRLGSLSFAFCASPDYLHRHGPVTSIDGLAKHRPMVASGAAPRTAGQSLTPLLKGIDPDDPIAPIYPRLVSDDPDLIIAAALSGEGVGLVPSHLAREEFRTGRLVHLLPRCAPEPVDVNLIHTSRKSMWHPVRAMVDQAVQRTARELNAQPSSGAAAVYPRHATNLAHSST